MGRFFLKAAVALSLAGVGAAACVQREIPAPKPPEKETEGGGPSEDGLLFSASFDACTLAEGPQIQSDNFRDDCENPLSHIDFKSTAWKTVATAHVCSNDYLKRRDFGSWVYLFRVSERPGYLACGVNKEGKRGIIQSPMLSGSRASPTLRSVSTSCPTGG